MRDFNWAPPLYAPFADKIGMSDGELAAPFENFTRKITENLHAAIEARLKALVADGISIDRIRLEQRPDGSTAIVVDSIPDSTFRISYPDQRGD